MLGTEQEKSLGYVILAPILVYYVGENMIRISLLFVDFIHGLGIVLLRCWNLYSHLPFMRDTGQDK